MGQSIEALEKALQEAQDALKAAQTKKDLVLFDLNRAKTTEEFGNIFYHYYEFSTSAGDCASIRVYTKAELREGVFDIMGYNIIDSSNGYLEIYPVIFTAKNSEAFWGVHKAINTNVDNNPINKIYDTITTLYKSL